MTATTYEIKNEMFFLFLPCAAMDLGLFRACSGNVPGNRKNSQGTPAPTLLFLLRSAAPTGFCRDRNRWNTPIRFVPLAVLALVHIRISGEWLACCSLRQCFIGASFRGGRHA